jgi:hypothetical protein
MEAKRERIASIMKICKVSNMNNALEITLPLMVQLLIHGLKIMLTELMMFITMNLVLEMKVILLELLGIGVMLTKWN